ncbi:hypothetical protein EC973_007241 [Apophysomyces ossiformis]|uniref:EIPR1-like beta-propeller domain-containing protein n=1 Tax=Apophysomyces ossiformis TaxID=679940 RepID=A0A8H7BUG1_9FUNG|nr:hypothetical protein EC973_007241 [Apophysomyces ossiformis]
MQDTGIIALGSGNKTGDLYFVHDLSAKADRVQPRFQTFHKEQLQMPIHSLDWSGNHLLVGSNRGVTKLYSIRERKVTQVAEYVAPTQEEKNQYYASYPLNSYVKAVEFAPYYCAQEVHKAWQSVGMIFDQKVTTNRFLTTSINRLHIWDVLQENKPEMSFTREDQVINCASWSPHSPHNLIAFGSGNGLHLMDTRTCTLVWSAHEAHARPIRDTRFNPFIPYWLASGGEDGLVNIWDIRSCYHAPVAKVDGHQGVINKIAWSSMRCENLNTVSSDGTMKMWMLSPEAIPVWDTLHHLATQPKHTLFDDDAGEPEVLALVGAIGVGTWGRSDANPVFVGEDIEPSKGSVVAICPSKIRPGQYYCATNRGQLTSQRMRFNQRDRLDYHHRYDDNKDPLAYEIEHNIYCRQIKIAKQNLQKLKEPVQDEEQNRRIRQEQAAFLEDCLKPSDAIVDWEIDSLPDKKDRRVSRRLWNQDDLWDFTVNTFRKDLAYWSDRIPPNASTRYNYPFDMTSMIFASDHPTEEEPVHGEDDNGKEYGTDEEKQLEKERTPSPIRPEDTANIRIVGDDPPIWTNPDVKRTSSRPMSVSSTGTDRLRPSALKRVFSRRQQQPLREPPLREHTPPITDNQRTDRRNALHASK